MNPIVKTDKDGNSITIREYDQDRDAESGRRIMRELHWIKEDDKLEHVNQFYSAGKTLIGEVNGVAECLSASVKGRIRYLETDLALAAITAVTTGLAARRRGLALGLTAQLIAEDAAEGAEVAMLGVFDQGFYDKLGFGSGPCEINIRCDLEDMKKGKSRPAVRLSSDDWRAVHNAMLNRKLGHGSCTLLPKTITKAELKLTPSETYFGLGYRDDANGELTHFIWGELEGENGPLTVTSMAWKNMEQLRELLALLASLGDQIWIAEFKQPRGIQVHDLIRRPLKRPWTTKAGNYEVNSMAVATWQVRILDLAKCVAQTSLGQGSTEFNLELADPISQRLDADAPWNGIGGDWTVGFGKESYVKPGFSNGLPSMKASVAAFTRLWLGVASPTALSVTDNLSAPTGLLEELDGLLLGLPTPMSEWSF